MLASSANLGRRLFRNIPAALFLLVSAPTYLTAIPALAQDAAPTISDLKADPTKLVRPSGADVALAQLTFSYAANGVRIDRLVVISTEPGGTAQTNEIRAVQTYGIQGSKGAARYQARFRFSAPPGLYKYKFQLIDSKNRASVPVETTVEVVAEGTPLPRIIGMNPTSAAAGDKVVLTGAGFTAKGKGTTVALGKVAAKVLETSNNALVVQVPFGAVSAPMTVTNANGSAASPTVFNVINSLRLIAGGPRTVPAGQTIQFAAAADGILNRSVTWSVNGQTGGSSKFGTIDKSGNFVAPAVSAARRIEIEADAGAMRRGGKTNIVIVSAGAGGFVRDARGRVTLEIPASVLTRDTVITELSAQFRPSRNDLAGLPANAFPLLRFQSKTDSPSTPRGAVRVQLLLPTRVPAGSKLAIMARLANETSFHDAGVAVAGPDGLRASATLNVADLNFNAVVLHDPTLSLPPTMADLVAGELSTPPDLEIEEGSTLPVLVLGNGFAPGFTFVSVDSVSPSCSSSGLDLSAFPPDQILDLGPVLVSPNGTQLGFTARIHPLYPLHLNEHLCLSFRIDRADGSGAIQASVTTSSASFVVNGLPELIVCAKQDAARNCPGPETNLFTVEGIPVHRAIGTDRSTYRFSEMRVDNGAVLGIGSPVASIVADGTTYDLSTISAFLDRYGHLNREDGTAWVPDPSARIFQPMNRLVAIEVTGPVEIDGTIYLRGMHGGQNATSADLSWRGRLGGFAGGTFSGGAGGDGGVTQGSMTVNGQPAGDGTEKGKGRGANGALQVTQNLAGGGSRFDPSTFSFDDWFSTIAWIAGLIQTQDVLTRGNIAGTIGQAPAFAKVVSPQSDAGGQQPVYYAGTRGAGGNAPPSMSAILDEDPPFLIEPGGGGAGGGGGGSTYLGLSLLGISFAGDPGTGGAGGGGGGAAGALKITNSREFVISSLGRIDEGGRGGNGQIAWSFGGAGGGGGGGAGGVLKLQSPQLLNHGLIDASGGDIAGAPIAYNYVPGRGFAGRVQVLDGDLAAGAMLYYGFRDIGISAPTATLIWPNGRLRSEIPLPLSGLRAIGKGLNPLDIIFGAIDPTAPGPVPLRGLLLIDADMNLSLAASPVLLSANPAIDPGPLADLRLIPQLAGFTPAAVTQSPFPPFRIYISGVRGSGREQSAQSELHELDSSGNYLRLVLSVPTIQEFGGSAWIGHLKDIDFLSDGRAVGIMTMIVPGRQPTNGIHVIDLAAGTASLLIPWPDQTMASMSVFRAQFRDCFTITQWDPTVDDSDPVQRTQLKHYTITGEAMSPWGFVAETMSSPGWPGIVRSDGLLPGSSEPRITLGGVPLAGQNGQDNPSEIHGPAISSFTSPASGSVTGLESLVVGQANLAVFCQGAEPGARVELWKKSPGSSEMGLAIPAADNLGNCGGTLGLPEGFTTVWAKTADGGQPPDLLKRRVLLIPEGQITGFGITGITPSDGPVTGGTWVSIDGIRLTHGSTRLFFDGTEALQSDGCQPISFSDTCIRALSPPHAAGPAHIVATNGGESTTPYPGDLFTYDDYAALVTIGYDPSRVGDPPGWL